MEDNCVQDLQYYTNVWITASCAADPEGKTALAAREPLILRCCSNININRLMLWEGSLESYLRALWGGIFKKIHAVAMVWNIRGLVRDLSSFSGHSHTIWANVDGTYSCVEDFILSSWSSLPFAFSNFKEYCSCHFQVSVRLSSRERDSGGFSCSIFFTKKSDFFSCSVIRALCPRERLILISWLNTGGRLLTEIILQSATTVAHWSWHS